MSASRPIVARLRQLRHALLGLGFIVGLMLAFAPRPAAAQTINNEVFVMKANGTGQVNRTNNPAIDVQPAWSPNGARIAFIRTSASQNITGVFAMNANGSGQVRLTTAADQWPTWSPDGTRIAFDRNIGTGGSNVFEIFVMNANGSGQTQLSHLSQPGVGLICGGASQPAWSPDGTKIAFLGNTGCGEATNGIYVMNADGSNPVELTSGGQDSGPPDWSPDGTKIAFSRCGAQGTFGCDRFHIWVMNADGSGPRQVTDGAGDEEFPDWSPNGTKIAFMGSLTSGTKTGIWAINADGSGLINLTNDNGTEPDWSPNGAQIAYVRRATSTTTTGPSATASIPSCSATGRITVKVTTKSGASAPKSVRYRIDGGKTHTRSTKNSGRTGTVTVTMPNGRHKLEFWGVDKAGSQSTHRTASMRTDRQNRCRPPVPSFTG